MFQVMDSADSSGLVRPFLSLLLNIFKYRVNDYNFRCFFLNNMYRSFAMKKNIHNIA
jgi:hypothetical protein